MLTVSMLVFANSVLGGLLLGNSASGVRILNEESYAAIREIPGGMTADVNAPAVKISPSIIPALTVGQCSREGLIARDSSTNTPVYCNAGIWQPLPASTASVSIDTHRNAYPTMCRDLWTKLKTPYADPPSGFYWVYPKGHDGPVPVYCDFDTQIPLNHPDSHVARGLTLVWWGCYGDPFPSVSYPEVFYPAAAGVYNNPSIWIGLHLFRALADNSENIMWFDQSSIDGDQVPQRLLVNDVPSELMRRMAIVRTAAEATPHFDIGSEPSYFRAGNESFAFSTTIPPDYILPLGLSPSMLLAASFSFWDAASYYSAGTTGLHLTNVLDCGVTDSEMTSKPWKMWLY